MAGVGGVACALVRGQTASLKERVETWQVPGMDGYGAQTLGLGDSSFTFTAIEFGSSAAIETWAGLIEALQAALVSIVDDWGVTYTNCLITRVSPLKKRARVDHDGNGVCRGELTVEGVIT